MTGAGLPHSEIHGSKVGRHLPVAYRSLPRLSSVLIAKASTVGSHLLSQVVSNQVSSAVYALTIVFGMGTGAVERRPFHTGPPDH